MSKALDFKQIEVAMFINKKCSEAVTTVLQPEYADIKLKKKVLVQSLKVSFF